MRKYLEEMNDTVKNLAKNKRPHHGKINKTRYRIAQKYLNLDDKILDFGCARGEYVARLKEANFDVTGVDALNFEEDWAELGVADRCSVSDGKVPAGQIYDVVILFEVLEHIPNPVKFLKELKPIISSRLLITVPNCEHNRVLESSGLTYNHYVDSSHVNFFTKESLLRLLEETGFSIKFYEQFNPINPIIPFLYHVGIPFSIAKYFGKFYRFMPKKSYFTQFVVVEI